ncbi:MAG: hypothetical protein HYS32_01775 [Candidatus Woesearchaeota archaeon]|nr:MAG: hypothetical protein HYS32_01775 [Candidatus Woesearchaeota archaeon]
MVDKVYTWRPKEVTEGGRKFRFYEVEINGFPDGLRRRVIASVNGGDEKNIEDTFLRRFTVISGGRVELKVEYDPSKNELLVLGGNLPNKDDALVQFRRLVESGVDFPENWRPGFISLVDALEDKIPEKK